MGARGLGRLAGAGIVVLLAGCPAWGPLGASEVLTGQVFFPVERSTQATIEQVALAATVSLIDPAANQTQATTVTDAQGRFSLAFTGVTLGDQVYYLEAIKGLDSNAVGKDAARVRTLIQRKGGAWTSLNSIIPGRPAYLNASTTALSAIASLRSIASGDLPKLIGTVALGTPNLGLADTFNDTGTGVIQGDFTAVHGLITTALTADRDPFEALQYAGGVYSLKPTGVVATAVVNYLQPAMASVGETVVIKGENFATLGNTVTFNGGATATVTNATPNEITVTVPAGATSGNVQLVTGGNTLTAAFTLIPAISGDLKL